MTLVEFNLFENILYLGFISDFVSAGFSELVMLTNFRRWISCKLLTSLCFYIYVCVCVCDMQFVIVIQYNFFFLTGKEENERVTEKKEKKKKKATLLG